MIIIKTSTSRSRQSLPYLSKWSLDCIFDCETNDKQAPSLRDDPTHEALALQSLIEGLRAVTCNADIVDV